MRAKGVLPPNFILDPESQKFVSGKRWYVDRGYAKATIDGKFVYLHRMIMGVTSRNVQVDHINGNKSDNRINNLRICTNEQNSYNKQKSRKGTSKYKGVSWCKITQMWVVKLTKRVNGKNSQVWCRRFNSELDAAKAYDTIVVKYAGPFAKTNVMLGLLTDEGK